MSRGHFISADFAAKLGRTTKQVDATPLGRQHVPPRRGHILPQPWYWCMLRSNMDGSDLGDGNLQAKSVDLFKVNADGDDWEAFGNPVDAYPPPMLSSGQTLESGTWCRVGLGMDNRWHILEAACE